MCVQLTYKCSMEIVFPMNTMCNEMILHVSFRFKRLPTRRSLRVPLMKGGTIRMLCCSLVIGKPSVNKPLLVDQTMHVVVVVAAVVVAVVVAVAVAVAVAVVVVVVVVVVAAVVVVVVAAAAAAAAAVAVVVVER